MTKDFDGNEIKAGDEVVHFFSGNSYVVHGVWKNTLWVVSKDGRGYPSTVDKSVFKRPLVRHKKWINIYPIDLRHDTKEDANKAACPRRIACIPIEFEEGEGL